MKRHFACAACKINQSSKNHRYCLPCHAAYMRAWRKTHPLTLKQKIKDTARSYANVYFKKGKLIKKPCEICGNPKSQMHHHDYKKPLEIIWLCRFHHLEHHKGKLDISHIPYQKIINVKRKYRNAKRIKLFYIPL